MKVYLGFSCYSDFSESGRTLEKVFDSEEKAKTWVGDMALAYTGNTHPDYEWREYNEHEVE
jgi:hypothetical protein